MEAKPTPPYLAGLNPEQLEAVLHEGSPLLILAGAGSGKTRVITCKIAYRIAERRQDPHSILGVTFTNKAAAEMSERVTRMTGGAGGVLIKTFHAFGAWLLRRYGASLGLAPSFAIYDDEDSLSLLSSVTTGIPKRELSRYARLIARAKDYSLTPDSDLRSISADPRFPELYAMYQKRLREIGNVDFGDLIGCSVELLRSNEEARKRVHSRFTTVLVDEYQDSNVAQYELLKVLAGEGCYLCVVGDDDQSIYRFRGAEVRNILTFGSIFPGTKIIRLERNYRSTKTILAIASAVVANNAGRLGKTLRAERKGGAKAVLAVFNSHEEEASFCADLVSDGNLAGTAILYRTNAQSLPFETLFTRMHIPYRIVGALRFYDREEIKDSLAFLALLSNPKDEVAFRRIVNKPSRGIGESAVSKILARAAETRGDLIEASRIGSGELSKRGREGLAQFVNVVDHLKRSLAEEPLHDFVERVITESGLLEYHAAQDEVTGSQKVRNLDQLVNAAAEYDAGPDGLALFLEHIELDRSQVAGEDAPPDDERVTLITMHNTKGLEFDRVIITGLEEELFPGRRDEMEDDIEEERRLFYVSITRAKEELFLTRCRTRLVWGRIMDMRPSRFLSEIPEELVEYREGGIEGAGAGPDELDGFQPGQAVYHEDYGTGTVSKASYSNGRLLVQVRFETGMVAQFFPRYQPLERISHDG